MLKGMNTAEELTKRLHGDVYTDQKTLQTYSHDASLFEVLPSLVAVPKDVADVKKLVAFATEHNVTLTARSGGTGMDGGSLSESIVVDFSTYFTKIGSVVHEGDTGYATTQPGVFYRDFEKKTLAKNLLMPSYPASREICTVGGMVANNSGGELTLRYGKTENYIKELKVVFADGNEYVVKPLSRAELDTKMAQDDFEGRLYKSMFQLLDDNYDTIKAAKPNVHKNSAGYYLWNVWDRETGIFDLTKLIVGSQGTLCLITEITFKLIEPNTHSQMLVLFLDDLSDLGELVNTVLKTNPTTFESYDDKTLGLAAKFWWEFIKRLGLRNIFVILLNSIPESISILGHGFPKLVLQITYDGDDPEVLRKRAEQTAEELTRFHPRYTEVIRTQKEAEEYWLIRRESFSLLRHKVRGRKTAPFVDDISVNPKVLPEFFPKLTKIFEPYKDKMVYNIAGHIGDGNFHIIPLMDFTDAEARAIIPDVAQKVYDLVFVFGGSVTGEHNDGIIRTPFLKQQYGAEVYGLFEKTKDIFDPDGIFNPGKKVGGTMEYAIAHMKRGNY